MLIYVLLAAALLKAVMGHWIDMAVILAVAVVNALIGFIQESNAEKSPAEYPQYAVQRGGGDPSGQP
ncbi:hypothetical protein LNP05_11705 [Klebsiella pneumoniae subsp. pneumoniae]|nr:hypothetical protein [Klebsiella pneumoniae subsp. pneumoniae]